MNKKYGCLEMTGRNAERLGDKFQARSDHQVIIVEFCVAI
jgi:hypothetical protein